MATLFTKIINKEIPSSILYEDALCIAILDINPVNKGHALVIARDEYPTTVECPDDVLAHLMVIAKKLDIIMREKLNAEATNIIINNGPSAGQEIPHIHIHIIPRYKTDNKRLVLAKEKYDDDEILRIANLLTL